MYIIAVYDVDQKRVGKMLKICRKYLTWIQNSVFEGELTATQIERLKTEADKLMDDDDSLIIFKNRNQKWLSKEIVGKEKSPIGNIV